MEWIDAELAARGLPRRYLAENIPGLTETKVSLTFSGSRRLTLDEADAIRRLFGYALPHDHTPSALSQVHATLSQLDAPQLQTVAMYLSALTGDAQTQSATS